MHLDQNVSLKSLHTFGTEVRTRYFVEAKSHSEILTLMNYRKMIHMPILFLGGGSNVLFTRDFAGIVIRISSKGIVIREEDENEVLVTAEAGENWDEFVGYCISNGWGGLENLSMIPGTVGAAPIQNIGAYGVEVKETIESVLYADLDSGTERRLTKEACGFGYRDSIFKKSLRGQYIILNVTFRLRKTAGNGDESYAPRLDYGDIRGELLRMGIDGPSVADVRNAVCAIRRRKLPDPAEIGNAGSFFKNPVVDTPLFISLRERFPEIPSYPAGEGRIKIPAAWLIDQCGWKGFRDGDTGVHTGQPLVLVNYGQATGRQVLDLADRIIGSIRDRFGITLETEVNIIG